MPTVADRNNNPGNLRDPQTGTFRTFATPQEGYAALLNDLQGKVTGNTRTGLNSASTLFDFAKTYAPSSDNNNPAQYTANLANTLGIRPDTTLGQLQPHIGDFAQAIAKNEGYTAASGFKAQLPIGQAGVPSILGVDTANASTGQSSSSAPQPQTDQPNAQGYYDMSNSSVSGFVGNAANDVGGIVSSIAGAVMHPIKTAQNMLGMGAGGVEKLFGVNNQDTQLFDGAVGYLKNKYGGDSLSQVINHVGHSLYTDPVGVALDLSTLLDGVGAAVGAVGKVADVSRAADLAKAADFISTAKGLVAGSSPEAIDALKTPGTLTNVADTLKTAGKYTNPVTPLVGAAGKVADLTGSGIKSTYAKLVGLNNQVDVQNIIDHPELFSKAAMEQMNRGSVANEFAAGLDRVANDATEAGASYNPIRGSGAVVHVPENWLSDLLSKGTTADESGKAIPFKFSLEKNPDGSMTVVADSKSFTRNPSDIKAIQDFVNNWGGKTKMTAEEFLNMRADASKMAKFGKDLGRNDVAELVGKAIRADSNKVMRNQIPNLAAKDAAAAPAYQLASEAKKTFLTADGQDFKPGAINKIANATGKGKDQLLTLMEKISPGITQRIQTLKTVESIESAYNIKAGTYMKDIVGTAGLLTGNVPAIISAILTHPSVAIPLLRGLGYTARTVKPLLNMLKLVAGDPQLLKYYATAGNLSTNATAVSNANQNNKK